VSALDELARLATAARAFGVDEMQILHATTEQIAEFRHMPGARYAKQPWNSLAEGCWKILETVRLTHGGVVFFVLRSYPATAADLVEAMPPERPLRSLP
jgi:hypothetical protein